MKVIGLTGGAGSGKSYVARVIEEEFLLPVIYTDEVAKEQMKKGGASFCAVVKEFGEVVLDECGQINRSLLARIVFEDSEKLSRLNEITHPLVKEEVFRAIAQARIQGCVAIFIETALFIEAGYDSFCDEVWYVYAKEEERRDRLQKTRNYSEDKIRALFQRQKKEEEFRHISTHVIMNGEDVTKQDIQRQVKNRMDCWDIQIKE